jgi:hypothetical protein
MEKFRCTYLLPIRRRVFSAEEAEELRQYFLQLPCSELLVIDGSAEEVFAQHDRAWSPFCRHIAVDRSYGYLNDKVNGVHTGVALAGNEGIILADDDIRYSALDVQEVVARLEDFEVVRPQNFLRPLPWWARLESARMLINRATLRTADYPGTCAFRRSTLLRVGHYDGDVLFDNEEIIRHFARCGASVCYANDLFIQKRPPAFHKWLEQRPRQAYEDFPLRAKTALFAAIPPLLVALIAVRLTRFALALFVAVPIALAWGGRRRGIARRVFPLTSCFFAPLWIAERSLSTWCAAYWFLRRGGYPFGDKLLRKGVGRDWFAGRATASSSR